YSTASRNTWRSASGIEAVNELWVPSKAGMTAPESPCCCWASCPARNTWSACAACFSLDVAETTLATPWMTVACSSPDGRGSTVTSSARSLSVSAERNQLPPQYMASLPEVNHWSAVVSVSCWIDGDPPDAMRSVQNCRPACASGDAYPEAPSSTTVPPAWKIVL